MDQNIVITSLEALIQRATNPQNRTPDRAAIEAVCGLINKEPEYSGVAAKLIISKVQSLQEAESLQALSMLDMCMEHCGTNFHTEVGKFKFLNELIKLVSPKYYGFMTPSGVQAEVLSMLESWVHHYPKETKIKEAYEMLKKQGVIKDEAEADYDSDARNKNSSQPQAKTAAQKASILEDEEKSRMLQKLLQSKNPEDLQAANRLIKSMVKEEERRVELNCKRVVELEGMFNNAKLLSEMLDSYSPGGSAEQDLELIKELHSNCLKFRSTVFKLAADVKDNKALYNEVLTANDALGDVFDKYAVKILGRNVGKYASSQLDTQLQSKLESKAPSNCDSQSQSHCQLQPLPPGSQQLSLLDLSSPVDDRNLPVNLPLLAEQEANDECHNSGRVLVSNDMDLLSDIFGALSQPDIPGLSDSTLDPVPPSFPVADDDKVSYSSERKSSKSKGLDELDILSETLLKQSLSGSGKTPVPAPVSFSKNSVSDKTTLNQLASAKRSGTESSSQPSVSENIKNEKDLDLLADAASELEKNSTNQPTDEKLSQNGVSSDCTEADSQGNNIPSPSPCGSIDSSPMAQRNTSLSDVKSLSDIFVPLETIKPGPRPPLAILNEVNGVTVVIYLAVSTPRDDVSVFVVTTSSKNENSLSNYLFQPVVPKGYRLRLQPVSCSELPPYSPFCSPPVITQVMLIASPTKAPIDFQFVLSYTMDGETITELGKIPDFPLS